MRREELLRRIKKQLGKEGITNGKDISDLAKELFGDRFIGIYIVKTNKDVPELSKNQIAILNSNNHWYAIFEKNGKLYETDSYGRDMLGPKYIDDVPPKSFIQGQNGIDKMDCGSRLLVNLIEDSK